MRSHFVVLLAIVSLNACNRLRSSRIDSDPPANAPVTSRADSSWADLGHRCDLNDAVWNPRLDSSAAKLEHGRDIEWAQIAREVSGGFAGIYYDRDTLVVLLTDTLQKSSVLPQLARRLPSRHDVKNAVVRRARWNFAELHDWWAYLTSQKLGLTGLTQFDINERANRLEYGFKDIQSLRDAERQLQRVDVPCYLIAFVVAGPIGLP